MRRFRVVRLPEPSDDAMDPRAGVDAGPRQCCVPVASDGTKDRTPDAGARGTIIRSFPEM